MYHTEKERSNGDFLYGIADENGLIISFTPDFNAAENLVTLLNGLEVERCHVIEIVEDLFYS